MKKIYLFIVLMLWATIARAAALHNDLATLPPQSVGLVLSGGGAKGIAHIGVIQALEDNDIPIDYITGTSMGAIVGSLYACGLTPAEMMDIIQSRNFAYWSTGKIDRKLTYYFLQDEPSPAILNLTIGNETSRWKPVLPSSLINPLPMNFAFMELFAAYTAQCGGDFNRLFVPFRCVASDVEAKHKVVFSRGSLGDAVRASMTFPLVFQPIKVDGATMYDGGIYDNFPVDVMLDNFAPQMMIGVDVSASDSDSDSQNMMSQLETMIMQHNDYSLPANRGIKLRLNLDRFGLLDFDKAQAIYDIGYQKAMEMMDSIKTRVAARMPGESRRLRREVFKSQTPYLHFDSVLVSGGSHQQDEYVKYLFTHHRADTFGLSRAREAYYRAITPGKLQNLQVQAIYNDSSRLFTLDLDLKPKPNLSLGIGGYITTATNSMLYLSAAYRTLNFNSLDMRLSGWVGQNYLGAVGSAEVKLLRAVPSSLQLLGVASRHKLFGRDRLFFLTDEPTAITSDEYFGRMTYGVAAGRNGRAELGVGYGLLEDKYYYNGNHPIEGRDVLSRRLAQVRALYRYNTLNSIEVPTAGAYYDITAMGVVGQSYVIPADTDVRTRNHRAWLQAEFTSRNYWELSGAVSLGLETDIFASQRKLPHLYSAALCEAQAFVPAVSMADVLAPGFRANSFAAVGFVPVWKLSSMFQLRGQAHCFVPLRPIVRGADGLTAEYGDWVSRAEFFGAVHGVVTLPFGNLTAYTHYSTAAPGRWNFGLSFGLYLTAPKFLK